MPLRFGMLVAALMVASCSNSAQQLQSGDPHVCANTDVTEQLFNIIKQHVNNPISDSDAREFNVDPKSWLKKVIISIDNVNSTNVDKDNQKIDCNAVVHFTADGTDGEQNSEVNYRVSPDLSSDKIVVSADTSKSIAGISNIIALIAKPDIEKPLKERADAANARNEAIMAAENARGEAWRRETDESSNSELVNGNCQVSISSKKVMNGICSGKVTDSSVFITADSGGCTVEINRGQSNAGNAKLFAYKDTCWIDENAGTSVENDINLGHMELRDGCWIGRNSEICLTIPD